MTGINTFAELQDTIITRVEVIEVEGKDVYVREMNAATTMELMKRSPNTIKHVDGKIVTDNSTNRLDMGYVLSRCVVRADNQTKVLNPKAKEWSELPSRIIQPIFLEIIKISESVNTTEEDQGNDEASS